MATLRQIRRRIRSVQSTMQITKAMEMLSAAKLRRAQAAAIAARRYAAATEGVLARVAGSTGAHEHPAFAARAPQRVLVAAVASDRGLCGGFNANVLIAADRRRRALAPARVEVLPIGRRAAHALGLAPAFGVPAVPRLEDRSVLPEARNLARRISVLFAAGEVDRVEFVYTRFITTSRRTVEARAIFPLEELRPARDAAYLFEPDAPRLLEELLPRYATAGILAILTSSLAAEHSARMLAMGNATRNADEMIDSLTLTANKLRQASITKELLEIVGGSAGVS
jgi:F-type H+-transporting ATPase subunit gamma